MVYHEITKEKEKKKIVNYRELHLDRSHVRGRLQGSSVGVERQKYLWGKMGNLAALDVTLGIYGTLDLMGRASPAYKTDFICSCNQDRCSDIQFC